MAYLIDRLKDQLQDTGKQTGSRRARQWIRQKVKDLANARQTVMRDNKRKVLMPIIGKMYFYFYDPKTKDTLKYYDKFPLVIPIENYPDGFLGLNLHYIHPRQRLLLLDSLSEYATNSKYDSTTRLRLSYGLLARASKHYQFAACVKRYLYSHVQSQFLEINADEWDIAVLLPAENFEKANKDFVYAESRKQF
jgi:hypothetical protein